MVDKWIYDEGEETKKDSFWTAVLKIGGAVVFLFILFGIVYVFSPQDSDTPTVNQSSKIEVQAYKGCWCPDIPINFGVISYGEYVFRTGRQITVEDFKKFCLGSPDCCNLYQWNESGHHPYNSTSKSYCDFIGEKYW